MPSAWIFKRQTATGGTRYRVGYTLGGRGARCRYGGSFKTKREAKIRRDWIAGELAALRVPDLSLLSIDESQAPTFAVAAAAWVDSRIDVSEGTKTQNRTSVNRAMQVIGSRRLDQLQPQDIASMVVQLHDEGVATGYLRKVVQAVAMTFDHAGIKPNPARDKTIVRMPRNEQEEISPPSAEHVIAVYRLLPTQHRLALLFLDWSGARVSAIDHTLVGDYDEPRRRVRLRASTTKTRRALWIDLPDDLADAIESTLPHRKFRDPEARLFAGTGSDALRTSLGKACRSAGVPLFSPHDLRHRRISLLHLRGVPWARIGEFVGQRNLAVTANTYSHVLVDEAEIEYGPLLQIAQA
jgi:integrase